jgi:hypothetical protein
MTQFWDKALHLVQPQTLLRWHRDLFRRYWKRISKPQKWKPRNPQETIDLIKEMAQKTGFGVQKRFKGNCLNWASK